MSIPNTRQRRRRPTHPGEMLQEDFVPEYGLTVAGLAEPVRVSRQSINELLRGRRAVSPRVTRVRRVAKTKLSTCPAPCARPYAKCRSTRL